jgi:hypothetical protein
MLTRHERLAVGLLTIVACGCGSNGLTGPLAFPVNAEFATVGFDVSIVQPGATGIYLIDQTPGRCLRRAFLLGERWRA